MKGAAKPCLTDDFCSTEPGGNVVNHDFGLLVGTFDDVMIGIYHRGYFNSGIAEGSITPAEYIGYQIASCYLQLQFDPITTGLLINTFSFELFGNTAAEIPTVTVTLGGAAYKLTKITYTGVRTQYYIELGQDQALFNYLDTNRNKTEPIYVE